MKNPFQEIDREIREDTRFSGDASLRLDVLNKQRLKALYQVGQKINQIINPDLLFEEIIRQVRELLKAEHVVILIQENQELRIRIAHNMDEQSRQNALTFSRSIVSQVMHGFKPIYSKNALHDPNFSQLQTVQKLEIFSFICVPIMVEGRVIGTIYVDNRKLPNVFDKSDVDFLQAFANLLGIAIRNSLAYQKLDELNRSLEEKVKSRTAQLQKALEELQETQERLIRTEKMASLGRLIAGFLHEFNNPINFVYSNLPHLEEYTRMMLAALEDALRKLPPEERQEFIEKYDLEFLKEDFQKLLSGIREGTVRTRELVNELRQFSSRSGEEKELIHWQENLQFVTRIFRERFHPRVKIAIEGGESVFVRGNRSEMNQVILNLLRNAVDAGATEITIRNAVRQGQLRCEIQDNGSGIEPENLSRIFDPFFTTKEVGKGMGLGLSIVYNIIQNHQGNITVHSQPGQGTTFVITLPVE